MELTQNILFEEHCKVTLERIVIEAMHRKRDWVLGVKCGNRLIVFVFDTEWNVEKKGKRVIEDILIRNILFCIIDQPRGERFVVYSPQNRTVVTSNDPNNISGLSHSLLIVTSLTDLEKKIAKTIINIIKKKEENKKRKKVKKNTVEGIVKSR
jgi:hypothetical protein